MQFAVVQTVDQSSLQGLHHVLTCRDHRQEMGFIDHQEMFILIEDGFVKRDLRFIGDFAEVMDPRSGLMGCIKGQWLLMSIQHQISLEAAAPDRRGDGWKVVA